MFRQAASADQFAPYKAASITGLTNRHSWLNPYVRAGARKSRPDQTEPPDSRKALRGFRFMRYAFCTVHAFRRGCQTFYTEAIVLQGDGRGDYVVLVIRSPQPDMPLFEPIPLKDLLRRLKKPAQALLAEMTSSRDRDDPPRPSIPTARRPGRAGRRGRRRAGGGAGRAGRNRARRSGRSSSPRYPGRGFRHKRSGS